MARTMVGLGLLVALAASACGNVVTVESAPDGEVFASLSGTACGNATNYEAPTNVDFLYARSQGQLVGVAVLDGPLFNDYVDAEWVAYAQSHDTAMYFRFEPPIPFAPGDHKTSLMRSLLSARGLGSFVFNSVEIVTVSVSSVDESEAKLRIVGPIAGASSSYPYQEFDDWQECPGELALDVEGPWTEVANP